MVKKIALNIFYNLGVILSIFGVIWGYNNNNYVVILAFSVLGALFLYLKLKLVREVKDILRK